MDAELKAEWVAALRSGDYKQGYTYLCRPDRKMCCLGVLADVDGQLVDDEMSFSYPDFQGVRHTNGEVNRYLLTPELVERYGFGVVVEEDDAVQGCEVQTFLSFRNDTSGWSFDEIADWVEGQEYF